MSGGKMKKSEQVALAIATIKKKHQMEFFKDVQGEPHISFLDSDRLETYSLRSSDVNPRIHALALGIDRHLTRYDAEKIGETFYADAIISKVQKEVYVRVAHVDNIVYVDLADIEGRCVVISQGNVKIEKNRNISFIRPNKLKALPVPKRGSRREFLRKFRKLCNFEVESNWILLLALLIKFLLRDMGSQPIAVLEGQQGAGKTVLCKRIRYLLDPSEPALSSPPTKEEHIRIQVASSYLLAFDNLSGLKNAIADLMCRVSTGGGISYRHLYTSNDEGVIPARNPLLLNGIDEPSVRPDFLERCVTFLLTPLDPSSRKVESVLDKEFLEDWPELIGGVYDLLSESLKYLPEVQRENLPRMTDFARVGIAMERALQLESGSFLTAYEANLHEQAENSFWNDPVCSWVYVTLARQTAVIGTASRLLEKISYDAKRFSKTSFLNLSGPKELSSHLRRIEPILKRKGFAIYFSRTSAKREIMIYKSSNKIEAFEQFSEKDSSRVMSAYYPADDDNDGSNAKKAIENTDVLDL